MEDLHIYPKVKGVLLSWKAAKGLNILPQCYPQPCGTPSVNSNAITTTTNHTVTLQQIMQEFPTIFDGHIKTMEGEKFHIALTDDARPFYVKAPRVMPFTY